MKKFRFIHLIFALLLCFSFSGFITIADAENERTVIYQTDDSTMLNHFTDLSGEWVVDPADSGNKIYNLKPLSVAYSTTKYLRYNLTNNNPYGQTKTYAAYAEAKEIDLSKVDKLMYRAKIYMSQAQINNFLAAPATQWDEGTYILTFVPKAGSEATSSCPIAKYGFYKWNDKFVYGKYSAKDSACETIITPDTWHEFIFTVDISDSAENKISIYCDNKPVVLNEKTQINFDFSTMFMGSIEMFDKTTGKTADKAIKVAENGLYVDDIEIYVMNTAFESDFKYNKDTARGEIVFTTPVRYVTDRIKFCNSADNTEISADIELAQDGKSAEVIFKSPLEKGVEYTAVFAKELTDIYGQVMAGNTDKIVTFSVGEAPKVDAKNEFWNIPDAYFGIDGITKVSNISGKSEAAAYTNGVGANGYSPRKAWNQTTDSFPAFSMNRHLFESIKIYLPPEVLNAETAPTYSIKLNGGGSAQAGTKNGFGKIIINANETKNGFIVREASPDSADDTTYLESGASRSLPADTWITLTYVYYPDSNYADLFIDNILFSSTKGSNSNSKVNSDKKCMDGIRFKVTNPIAGNNLYISEFAAYQMVEAPGVKNITYDAKAGRLEAEFNTVVSEAELTSGKLRLFGNGTELTDKMTFRALEDNCCKASFALPVTALRAGQIYTLTMEPGFRDNNLQTAVEASSQEFMAPSSDNMWISASAVSAAPSEHGMTVTAAVTNSADTIKNGWAILAVYDSTNCLIGIDDVDVTNLAPDETKNYTFIINNDLTNTEKAVLLLWNSKSDMTPYQDVHLLSWSTEEE